MNCTHCEEQLSDYLENALGIDARDGVELHLRYCEACGELVAGMKDVLAWGEGFPIYDPPAWLSSRILANTPRVARETWRDTLSGVAGWIAEPRLAMVVFTAAVVLGWMGSLAGISPVGVARVVRDPAILYYEAGTR